MKTKSGNRCMGKERVEFFFKSKDENGKIIEKKKRKATFT